MSTSLRWTPLTVSLPLVTFTLTVPGLEGSLKATVTGSGACCAPSGLTQAHRVTAASAYAVFFITMGRLIDGLAVEAADALTLWRLTPWSVERRRDLAIGVANASRRSSNFSNGSGPPIVTSFFRLSPL